MRIAAGLLAIALLYALPAAAAHPYLLHVLALSCIYAIPAIGLNVMLGYTGLVSLGHMAFAGIGAYTAAVLMVDAKLGFWPALGAATLAAGAAGFAVGAICLRFRTHYFMIVTLAFGLLLHQVMNNWDEVTRGAAGFPGIPRPAPLALGEWTHSFGPLAGFYRLALTGLLAAFAVQWLIVRSDFGKVLSAIRQDEKLAAFKGANTMLYKTAVFAAGSAIAGFGGVFFVSFLRAASPDSFTLAESINMVLIVIIGGAGSLAGPIVGALVYIGVPELLRAANELRLVVFGVLLILITLFAPQGLAGLIESAISRLRRR
ncbi:MAG: branched-chain amino acid ABC transporter permease [Burkholderiales bacterium]